MPESDVKDGIGCGRTAVQALQIFQITSLYLSAGSQQRLCACIAACKAKHLVTRADKLRDNSGADKPCCTCHENAHRDFDTSLELGLTKAAASAKTEPVSE